jgi:hypothetical protein
MSPMPATPTRVKKDQRHDDHQQQAKKQLAHRVGDVVDEPGDARMVAGEQAIHGDAGNHADDQADEDPCVQCETTRFVGCGFVEIGAYFAFEFVAV